MQQPSLDLAAFFKLLARRFFTLLLFTALGGGIGFGVSSLITPKWKAVAQIDAPKISELGNYFNLFSTYTFLNGGEQLSYKLIKDEKGSFALQPEVSKSTENLAIDNAYAEFKRNLMSPDVLQQFLMQSQTVQSEAKNANLPVANMAQTLASQFQFQQATRSNPVDRISVISKNPEQANELLSGFILFANQQTKTVLNNELIVKWKALFQQTKAAADQNLGAVLQGNQVASQDWAGKLAMMKSVQPLDDKLTAYRFVKAPSVPTTPDSPNKLFWLMIGSLSGLLLGILVIAMANLINRKVKNDE